jgi:selenocysteine lyase/cysteine desulfurase
MDLTRTPLTVAEVAARFAPATGYLAACTMGLPLAETLEAQRDDLELWSTGARSPVAYGGVVEQARASYAQLVGVPVTAVAVGSQTSAMVAVVAAAVPDGAEVVCVDGDFSSVVYPFLQQAHRGVTVRSVPVDELADAVGPGTWCVAWSAVQSATGVVADDARVRAAAAAHGALTLCDVTQAAGVLPVDASAWDVSVGHAYKWLCCPRGAAFMTLSDRALAELRPVQAGWYAGESVWASCYGPAMDLARDARAFDVSPAWPAWPGAAAALATFARLDPAETWAHAAGLGDELCRRLDLPEQRQAVVTWLDADGGAAAAMGEAGLTVSARAGRVRVAFHLWNTSEDVEAVAASLGR